MILCLTKKSYIFLSIFFLITAIFIVVFFNYTYSAVDCCYAECKPTDPPKCKGNIIQVCGECDADQYYDWCDSTDCSATGQSCVNGICQSSPPGGETNCSNGLDDDGDSYIDCVDFDCAGFSDGTGICCKDAGGPDDSYCPTCQRCIDATGGDPTFNRCANQNSDEGINCTGPCTLCQTGVCQNRTATSGLETECTQSCLACADGAGGSCTVNVHEGTQDTIGPGMCLAPDTCNAGVCSSSEDIRFGARGNSATAINQVLYTEAGVEWNDMDIVWQEAEPSKGQYDFSTIDYKIEQNFNLGIETTFELEVVSDWGAVGSTMTPFPTSVYPNDEAAWIDFIKVLAERYDGDADYGCTLPSPNCYQSADNQYPSQQLKDATAAKSVNYFSLLEEFPSSWKNALQFPNYVNYAQLLGVTNIALKQANLNSKLISAGSVGILTTYAYLYGFIDDSDVGIIGDFECIEVLPEEIPPALIQLLQERYTALEYIINDAEDNYDIFGLHVFHNKPNWLEGEIAYLKSIMEDPTKPILITAASGPHKLTQQQIDCGVTQGNICFGNFNLKEHAEFIVKQFSQALASGVARMTWTMGSTATVPPQYLELLCTATWAGSWHNTPMTGPLGYTCTDDLDDATCDLDITAMVKKPAFYTYKMMVEKLSGFTSVQKIAYGKYKFTVNGKPVVVAWNDAGPTTINLSSHFSTSQVKVTPIVTQLDAGNNPIYPSQQTYNSNSVAINFSPVFIEETTLSCPLMSEVISSWHFDEGLGTTANDSSPNNLDLTLNATALPNWSTEGSETYLNFDQTTGDNLYITAASDPTGLLNLTSDFTLILKIRTIDNIGVIFDKAGNITAPGWGLGIVSNTLRFYANDSLDSGGWYDSFINISNGSWHYLALTGNAAAKTLDLWVDATYIGTIPAVSSIAANSQPLVIGRLSSSTLYNFNGDLDEIAIYNHILSDSDIENLTSPPPVCSNP